MAALGHRPTPVVERCDLPPPDQTLAMANPRRLPSVWEDGDAQMDDGAQSESDLYQAAQPAPYYEVDQRISW